MRQEEDCPSLTLKMEEGAMSQGDWWPLRTGKSGEMILSLAFQQEYKPVDTFILTQ
jgi:hypothetical protein